MAVLERATIRRAAKEHPCWGCRSFIKPGELHVEHVTSPGHPDVGNQRWVHARECADCAMQRGYAMPEQAVTRG